MHLAHGRIPLNRVGWHKPKFTMKLPTAIGVTLLLLVPGGQAQEAKTNAANLALVGVPSSAYVSGDTSLTALNDGPTPRSSRDNRQGSYGNWPRTGTQWVQYDWPAPVSTKQIEVYWWDDRQGVRLPKACRLQYWDGKGFVSVSNATGLGVEGDRFNATTFDEIQTSKLRLEIDGDDQFSTGLLEWRVYDSGKSPEFPPSVIAGVDRVVVLGGKTYLLGKIKTLKAALGPATLTPEWRGDLLQGVLAIKGQWADGSPLLAIPNFARNNRAVQTAAPAAGSNAGIDYSGGATVGSTGSTATNAPAAAESQRRGRFREINSQVWMKAN